MKKLRTLQTRAISSVRRLFVRLKRYPKTLLFVTSIIVFHIWLHLANPYTGATFVQQPFSTTVANNQIYYTQHFIPNVYSDNVSDLLGYYRQGFLIVQNTFFGGKRLSGQSADEIIDQIHAIRFDPSKPYLISGDQFSVLYPRNLGVFYNQLLDPETARSKDDWENRQRIYLQSALYAIEGLSDNDTPKTTLIPIGPWSIVTTQVHPGDIASDSVYGLLYSLDTMNTDRASHDGAYAIQTSQAIRRILDEKESKLRRIVDGYVRSVQDPESGLIRNDVSLASARDGVTRKSSFYDNVVLWKTLQLADRLGIRETSDDELERINQLIRSTYWNETKGYYNNDSTDPSFTSDWLIGYVTGFFDITDPLDRDRTAKTLHYIKKNRVAEPLPIKYQTGEAIDAPIIIKLFVPSYGSEAIWSYWGAQYITLLVDMARVTENSEYKNEAATHIKNYEAAIVRDGGFAETYSPDGTFFRHGLYKSIRVTGWVVQFEHARKEFRTMPTGESPLP